MKFLIVNSKESYTGKLQMLREHCVSAGLQVDFWDNEDKTGVVDHALQHGYAALLHRNEHGRLFADGSLVWIRDAVARGMPVLSADFGYLDHYKTCMFDFYRRDLSSGIHEVWGTLPDRVDWDAAPKYVRKHRASVLERIAQADGSGYFGKVGVWMQWTTDLLRHELCDGGKRATPNQAEWVNRVCDKIIQLGLEPVVKMGVVDHTDIYKRTVPFIRPGIQLVCDKKSVAASNPRSSLDPQANWRMLAGCSYHVILCSSVSHLMVLANRPVIATGASWFNALGIFQEYAEWDSPFIRPTVNHAARAKWVNWWLLQQRPWSEAASTLRETYALARRYHDANAG